MINFNGYRVFKDTTVICDTVRRTWKERLLTRPWKPWKIFKQINHRPSIADGKCLFIKDKDCIVVNPKTFTAMIKDAKCDGPVVVSPSIWSP